MDGIAISGYLPGAIGRITELHATYYSKQWEFSLFFEAKVATDMSFFLSRFNQDRDGFWVALKHDRIMGSIAIDGIKAHTKGAHLRWFIVDPKYHGWGIGKRLMEEAMGFCMAKTFQKVYLWTFKGLDPARHLYEKNGFKLIREHDGHQWGVMVKEQLFERIL